MLTSNYWNKPRKISIVVDNDSWILPYANTLVSWCKENGDDAILCRTHGEIEEGLAAFYLGCLKITPPNILAKNHVNLVVHASDLPKGRGFSPWTYAVLEGKDKIPVCLIEAANDVDAGDIYYKEYIILEGTELVDDLRTMIGNKTVEFGQKFLSSPTQPTATPQQGEPTIYPRRTPKDSRLDPQKTIAEQFDLLRVVDNENYPAFFEHQGQKYKLTIEKN